MLARHGPGRPSHTVPEREDALTAFPWKPSWPRSPNVSAATLSPRAVSRWGLLCRLMVLGDEKGGKRSIWKAVRRWGGVYHRLAPYHLDA